MNLLVPEHLIPDSIDLDRVCWATVAQALSDIWGPEAPRDLDW